MRTIKELSDMIKVSKVSIYKAVKRDGIQEHVIKRDNITYVDEKGEQLLINLFNHSKQEVKQLKAENDIVNILTSRIENLEEELSKEREHSRQQADKIAALAEQLAQLTENGQILLREQNLKRLPEVGKTSFWNRLFKRKDKD